VAELLHDNRADGNAKWAVPHWRENESQEWKQRAKANGKTPFYFAMQSGHKDLAEMLRQDGSHDMRRYERASTLITQNRPVEDWGKLPGDSAAVTAMLDRLLHHGHLLKCGPRSWRTKTGGAGEGK